MKTVEQELAEHLAFSLHSEDICICNLCSYSTHTAASLIWQQPVSHFQQACINNCISA